MKYVLIYCEHASLYRDDLYPSFVVIEKDRPDYLKGKLNLPGGKIEKDETPIQAAVRELEEETGIKVYESDMKEMGTIGNNHFLIHCFSCQTFFHRMKPKDGETEKVELMSWTDVKHDKRLMTNLKLVIPLMMAGQGGWQIVHQDSELDSEKHTISFTISRN